MSTATAGPAIHPSPDTIANFRVPLEPGEHHLLKALQRELNASYEVFVQPFLNGDRPDVVIMRKGSGLLIIEVKDWNLNAYHPAGAEAATWELKRQNGSVRSPLQQVAAYKRNLYNLHVAELFTRTRKNSKVYDVVQTAVYFHNATQAELEQAITDPGHVHLIGHDRLSGKPFETFLHHTWLSRRSYYFSSELYSAVRRYLKPPIHSPDEGKKIEYSPQQERLIHSKADTRQKVRGVAGSGKTKILARRAVAAHKRTGRRVLILTYNITLCNYIRDRISEVRERFSRDAFHILNYHQFFAIEANNHGLTWETFEEFLALADNARAFESFRENLHTFEAIFIDEVQDYKEAWLRLIERYFLQSGGELVVFGDEKQNIYGRATDAEQFPVVPTIPGRWNELTTSYRMNMPGLRLAQAFQQQYLSERYTMDTDVELVQGELFKPDGKIRYAEMTGASHDAIFDYMFDQITACDMHPDEVAVVAPDYPILRALEQRFRKQKGENTSRAFESEDEFEELLCMLSSNPTPRQRRRFERNLRRLRRGYKVHFQQHDGTVKLATIHSFKGWEAPMLVLVLTDTGDGDDATSIHELLYTALTRFGTHLLVIDQTDGAFRDFFVQIADNVDLQPPLPPADEGALSGASVEDDDLPF